MNNPSSDVDPSGGDGPSQLLQAFVSYLRGRPMTLDTKSTGSVTDGTSQLEGVTRRASELGGVPAITLQPQVGWPDRTVIYFHGGGYVSGSPPERFLPLAARWLSRPTRESTSWTIGSLRNPASRWRLTTAFAPTTG
jgi:acetyl esterase/lipase